MCAPMLFQYLQGLQNGANWPSYGTGRVGDPWSQQYMQFQGQPAFQDLIAQGALFPGQQGNWPVNWPMPPQPSPSSPAPNPGGGGVVGDWGPGGSVAPGPDPGFSPALPPVMTDRGNPILGGLGGAPTGGGGFPATTGAGVTFNPTGGPATTYGQMPDYGAQSARGGGGSGKGFRRGGRAFPFYGRR